MGGQSSYTVGFYCMCGHEHMWTKYHAPHGELPKPPETITCPICGEQMLQSKKNSDMQRKLADLYQHW